MFYRNCKKQDTRCYLPNGKEIEDRCAEIQNTWTEQERDKRSGYLRQRAEVFMRVCSVCDMPDDWDNEQVA